MRQKSCIRGFNIHTSKISAFVTIIGFWPGDACEFGLLSYHHRGHMHHRLLQYGEEDRAEALHAQAIFASYGWLFPQACYQGTRLVNIVIL